MVLSAALATMAFLAAGGMVGANVGADVDYTLDCDGEFSPMPLHNGAPSLDAFVMKCPPGCSYAVGGFHDPCNAKCVRSESMCLFLNKHATVLKNVSQSSGVEKTVCDICNVAGCEECNTSSVPYTCLRCFNGFSLISDGTCVLADESAVLLGAGVALISLLLVIVIILVTSYSVKAWGARMWVKTQGWIREFKEKGISDFVKTRHCMQALRERLLPHSSAADSTGSQSGPLKLVNTKAELEALEEEDEKVQDLLEKEETFNAAAVQHGLNFARRSSIFAKHPKFFQSRETVTQGVGVGLVLFYNTQLFLILCSLIIWYAMGLVQASANMTNSLTWAGEQIGTRCLQGSADLVRVDAVRFATEMGLMCGQLFVILSLVTFGFLVLSLHFTIGMYDSNVASWEDYTMKLTNVPRSMTSERKFMSLLDEKLDALDPQTHESKIYGVSIAYDLQRTIEKISLATQITPMIENLIERDDIDRGWCQEKLAPESDKRKEQEDRDKKDFEKMLRDRSLRGSGEAFVVFKKQKYLHRALAVFRGIEWPQEMLDEQIDAAKDYHIVEVSGTMSEPTGVCWFNFNVDPFWFNVRFAQVHLVALALFVLFGGAAYAYYCKMMRPYLQADLPPDQDDLALQVAGNGVGIFNAIIQMVVQGSVLSMGYSRGWMADLTIFRLNTAVVALNTASQLFFFCWRGNIRLLLSEASPRDITTEYAFYINIQTMMTPNMFFVQYILNEVLTALAQILIGWLVLKAVFVWDLGNPFIKKQLLGILDMPRGFRSTERLYAREAEQALRLPPMLMSLEYTFGIVYPAGTFCALFLLTDQASNITGWLLVFTIFFYVFQRLGSLWMFRETTHDSTACFMSFFRAWGLVLALLPTATCWWLWRRGVLPMALGAVLTPATYVITAFFYVVVVDYIEALFMPDDAEDAKDPDVAKVMEQRGFSWWNVNPVYVLKCRFCPEFKGYEVHEDSEKLCWPKNFKMASFVEPGSLFRHKDYKVSIHHRHSHSHRDPEQA